MHLKNPTNLEFNSRLVEPYATSYPRNQSYWHNGLNPNLYFYRDKEQREIDLLLERDNKLYPVEFKKTASPNLSAAKHFSVLDSLDKPRAEGAIVCLRESDIPLSSEVNVIPVGYL